VKAGFSHLVFGCALLISVGSAILLDSFRAINCVVSSFPDVGVGVSKTGFSIWLIAFHLLDDEHVEAVSGWDGMKRGLIFFPILKREKLWTWRLPRHNQHTLIIFTHTAICFECLHVKCSVDEGLACRFSLQVATSICSISLSRVRGLRPLAFLPWFSISTGDLHPPTELLHAQARHVMAHVSFQQEHVKIENFVGCLFRTSKQRQTNVGFFFWNIYIVIASIFGSLPVPSAFACLSKFACSLPLFCIAFRRLSLLRKHSQEIASLWNVECQAATFGPYRSRCRFYCWVLAYNLIFRTLHPN